MFLPLVLRSYNYPPMLPHICPLLLEYTAAADAVFMQGSVQRGGWCKVQFDPHVPGSFIMFLVRSSCSWFDPHVPSCAQIGIWVFMIKDAGFDHHVPSCAQIGIRVFMIKEHGVAWEVESCGTKWSCEVSVAVISSTLQWFGDLFDTFSWYYFCYVNCTAYKGILAAY